MNAQNGLHKGPCPHSNTSGRKLLKKRKGPTKPKGPRLSTPSHKVYRYPLDDPLRYGPAPYDFYQCRIPQDPAAYPYLNSVPDPWRRRTEPPYQNLIYKTGIPPMGTTSVRPQFHSPRESGFTREAQDMINDGVSQPPLVAPSVSEGPFRPVDVPIRSPVPNQDEWVSPQSVQAAKSSMLDRRSRVHRGRVGHRLVVVPHAGSSSHMRQDRSERIVEDAVRSDFVAPSSPQPSAISDEEGRNNEGLWTELENMLQTMGRGLRNSEGAQDETRAPFSSNSPCDLEDLSETESSPPSLTRSQSEDSLSEECIFNGPLIAQGIVPSRVNPPVYTSLDDVPQHIRHLLAVRRVHASIKTRESVHSVHPAKLHRDVSYVYHAFRDEATVEDFEYDSDLEEND